MTQALMALIVELFLGIPMPYMRNLRLRVRLFTESLWALNNLVARSLDLYRARFARPAKTLFQVPNGIVRTDSLTTNRGLACLTIESI